MIRSSSGRLPRSGYLVATVLALGGVGAATAIFCVDRLMNRTYPPSPLLGIASDIDNYFYPSIVYLQSLVRHGELPLWNPYQMAGEPFLAVHQSSATYPLLVCLLWLPPHLVLAVHAVLHVFLAGAFTLLYARRLGYATSGALAAGLCYMFSYVVIGAIFNTAYLSTYVWLPAMLWGVYEIADTHSLEGVVLLAIAIALSIAGGYAQGFVYSVQFAGIYALWLIPGADKRTKVVGLFLLAGLLGICVSAVQLTATIELASRAVHGLRGVTLQEAGYGLSTDMLINGLFAGTNLATVAALMIPFGALGIAWRGTRRHALFFMLGALVAADFMRGTAGYVYPLYFHLPAGNVFRLPVRMAFVYAFSAAMLVAAGQTALLRAVAGWPWLGLALAMIVPVVAGAELYKRSEIPVRYAPLVDPESLERFLDVAEPASARGQYERLFIERDIPSQVLVKVGQMTGGFVLPDYEPALPASIAISWMSLRGIFGTANVRYAGDCRALLGTQDPVAKFGPA